MREPEGSALVPVRTRACMVCGRVSVLELPAPIADAWAAGAPVQALLPGLPPPMRELLVSGTHPTCWADMFGAGPG